MRMLVKTQSSAVIGIEAKTITVEVHISSGTKYVLVGLPDNAVKESLQRIESAILASGYRMPRQKIVINLAPADLRKAGSSFDLAIALAILSASKQLSVKHLKHYVFIGELSLDGTIQSGKGALPIASQAQIEGFKGVVVPYKNAAEAGVVEGIQVYGMNNLREIVELLSQDPLPPYIQQPISHTVNSTEPTTEFDYSDVKGQETTKRALEIAASGGHNVLLIGPPGSGKTMLAQRISGILPPLSLLEAIETTKIHSVAGLLSPNESLIRKRPFRSPHHTISDVALVGGGSNPQPGEISLAHHGVLFLDELPEFKRQALEVLRQPLESRRMTISRAKMTVDFPASFILITAMNPCPCGYFNHPEKRCTCTPKMVQKYLSKVSGPLLDRIDLHVEVKPVPVEKLNQEIPADLNECIRERVINARNIQLERFKGDTCVLNNAQLNGRGVRKHCVLTQEGGELLEKAMKQLQLSARAYDRILKVARTIADMERAANISLPHLAEAIQYRSLDRANWAQSSIR